MVNWKEIEKSRNKVIYFSNINEKRYDNLHLFIDFLFIAFKDFYELDYAKNKKVNIDLRDNLYDLFIKYKNELFPNHPYKENHFKFIKALLKFLNKFEKYEII